MRSTRERFIAWLLIAVMALIYMPSGGRASEAVEEAVIDYSDPVQLPWQHAQGTSSAAYLMGDTGLGMIVYNSVKGTYLPAGEHPTATAEGSSPRARAAAASLASEKQYGRVLTQFRLGLSDAGWQQDGALRVSVTLNQAIFSYPGERLTLVRFDGEKIAAVSCNFSRVAHMLGGFTFTTDQLGEYAILGVSKHKPENCYVTFYGMDGTVIEDREVADGAPIGAFPEAPELEGFVFTEWLGAEGVTAETVVTADLALTAAYAEINYPAADVSASVDGISVNISVPEGALPEAAQFRMTSVNSEDYRAVIEAEMGGRVGQIKAVDMSFVDDAGAEYQPLKAVMVEMDVTDMGDAERFSVLHIMDGGKAEVVFTGKPTTVKNRAMRKSGEGDNEKRTISFETDGFSVYVIAQIIEKTVTIDGATYKITVTYDMEADIPDGAELAVNEVAADDYLAAAAKALGCTEDDTVYYSKFLDISIVFDGAEIEPKTPVDVKVELLDVSEGAEALEVVHFTDNGAEKLTCAADGAGTVTFSTDSFSTFGFGSILRALLSWSAESADFTLQGFVQLQPDCEPVELTVEEGLEALGAYQLTGEQLMDHLRSLWLKVGVDMELADRQSVAIYSVRDGGIQELLAEENAPGSMLMSLGGADGFALVLDSGYRRKQFEAEGVTLNGMMPKAAEAGIEAAEVEGLEGELLAAYNISIEEEGEEYQPDDEHPVDVSISVGELAEGTELQVWHILDDGTIEEITGFVLEENTVRFTAAGFSCYAVTAVTLSQTVTTGDGATYEIQVTYHSTSGIPMENTALLVSEIVSGSENYDAYVAATADQVGATVENILFARAFDIKIVSAEDPDVIYEPTGDVDVSIRLIGAALEDYDNVSVLHFAEGEDRGVVGVDATVSGETVDFTTGGFSVYVVAGYTLGTVIEASDGNTYQITVTFQEDALLPEDAALNVTELTGEDCAEYLGRTAVAMNVGGFAYGRVFDISIVDGEGVEVQPEAKVQVSVKLLDAEDTETEFAVMHFAGEEEQAEPVEAVSKGDTVRFSAEGFSAYAIVQGPSAIPLSATKLTSVAELAEKGPRGLYVGHVDGYYMTNDTYSPKPGRTGIKKTKPAASYPGEAQGPARYYFIQDTGNQFYVYCLKGDTPWYVKHINNSSNSNTNSSLFLTDNPEEKTAFTAAVNNGQFTLNHGTWYWNMQGSANGAGFCTWNTEGDPNNNLYIWDVADFVDDPYGLDGKTYGLMSWNGGVTAKAMMAENDGAALGAKVLVVMTHKDDQGEHLFVPNDSDISMWTFKWMTKDQYCVKTAGGKYLKITSAGLTLVDEWQAECNLTVVPGTGAHAGQIYLKASDDTALTYSGLVENGFIVGTTAGSEWLYLVGEEELTDEYFRIYSAEEKSVAETLNGEKIIIYCRVWDDVKKEYRFYAINHDGTLVPCYESGNQIQWVGRQLDTMLWTFVEYQADGRPNDYYDLVNDYSGQYIAPQMTGGQTLSSGKIGVNLSGRKNSTYYTTIVAWDDAKYAYACLKADPENTEGGAGYGRVVTIPYTQAGLTPEAVDFAFARVLDLPVNDTLNQVSTVDHEAHGITMKIKDIGTREEMSGFLGSNSGGATYNLVQGLLSTQLQGNYPTVVNGPHRGESLSGLIGGGSQVNHLFIDSIYRSSGYFFYDSTQNFATLKDPVTHEQKRNFTVYHELGSYDSDGRKTLQHGQFFPFNELQAGLLCSDSKYNLYDISGAALSDKDPRKNERLYLIRNVDYYFAVELEAAFVQTPDGLDNWGHDIIYEFTGDDDFWLYVDGELVIDLGGIHSAVKGSVNYRTGAVVVNGTRTTLKDLFYQNVKKRGGTDQEAQAYVDECFDEKIDDGGHKYWTLKENKTHKMRIFYMERGAGASNLRMKFNLSSIKPNTVLLEKEIAGVGDASGIAAAFPYQIFYRVDGNTQETLLGNDGDQTVIYRGTSQAVDFQPKLDINGVTYQNVFLLHPGKPAEIDFKDHDGKRVYYRIVECGVNTEDYSVKINNVSVDGTRVAEQSRIITGYNQNGDPIIQSGQVIPGHENLRDFSTNQATTDDQPSVVFENSVTKKKLTITKRLFKADHTTEVKGYYNPATDSGDDTTFDLRLALGTAYQDGTELVYMYEYHIKDPDGNYCVWNDAEQRFVSVGPNIENLPTEATFHSSPHGSISKIPAGYSVEVLDILPGTQYRVSEEDGEIPDGYELLGYTVNGESRTENVPEGRVDSNIDITVDNSKGIGLRLNKAWDDADYMADRADTYFAVYKIVNGGETLVENSVRRLAFRKAPPTATDSNPDAQTLYWYYRDLPNGGTLSDYVIREVTIFPDNPTVNEKGEVTDYEIATQIGQNGSVTLNGRRKGETGSLPVEYMVSYVDHEPDDNVRVIDAENKRDGILLRKSEWDPESPLAGATFVLKDQDNNEIGTFTTYENGIITMAYLRTGVQYTLTETVIPQGYQSMSEPWTIMLNNNGELQIIQPTDTEKTAYCQVIPGQAATETSDATLPSLTIKNRPYTFQAIKKDKDSNQPIAGVHFELHKQKTVHGQTNFDINPEPGYEDLVTDSDGIIPKLDNTLLPGIYELREKSAPTGYEGLPSYIYFTVSENHEIILGSHPEGVTLTDETGSDGTLAYTMEILNKKTFGVELKKTVSGNAANPAAKYRIYVTVKVNGVEQNINGLAQFYELADHENVVLSGIPAGATIEFKEVDVVDFTTTATFNGVEEPVTVGKTEDQDNGERTFSIMVPEAVPEGQDTHEVTVNNHKHTDPPPTGIGLESTAFIMLMCLALFGMAALSLRRLAASRAAAAQGHERKRTFTGTR